LRPARQAVAHIVGRNVEALDTAGVARAAIESAAENFADAIVAPAFWYLAAGLPGLFLYKTVNTLDSMIGYRNERFIDFGRAAARFDDAMNFVPARIAGVLIVLAAGLVPGAEFGDALRTMWRDARKHASPNAGWPEAAAAGALGLRLGGPREDSGGKRQSAWLGLGRSEATAADIHRILRLYVIACALHALAIAGLAFAAG
jgi:adenosylcobinamide-phosphate synthase